MKQVSCGNLTTDTDTETDTDIKKFLESVSVDWLEELKMEVEVKDQNHHQHQHQHHVYKVLSALATDGESERIGLLI